MTDLKPSYLSQLSHTRGTVFLTIFDLLLGGEAFSVVNCSVQAQIFLVGTILSMRRHGSLQAFVRLVSGVSWALL